MSCWPAEWAQRAPLNDYPPAWASAWGDDRCGLWADLKIESNGLSATQRMRWIEPGEFLFGSTAEERASIKEQVHRKWANEFEEGLRHIDIGFGFWLADTPCTQGFWTAVMGSNPSMFQSGPDAPRKPVESVALEDVKQVADVTRFLEKLNQKLPKPLAQLPSEVEWEYACRADTQSTYWWGNAVNDLKANWDAKHEGPSPVDRYQPNPWGLFDMHGNVWEWCRGAWYDQYSNPYSIRPHAAPVRGGSWLFTSEVARCGCRMYFPRIVGDQSRGFRFSIASGGVNATPPSRGA